MVFDIDKTVQYWKEGSAYDLETGKTLLESRRFPYALFFGHLTLEKILKAIRVKTTKDHAPFTHSLTFLASKTKIEIPESILDKFAEYTEFHIESRCPDEKRDFYRRCTQEFARKKFAEIEEVYQWLIQKLQVSF